MTMYKRKYLQKRIISDGTYEVLCCEAWGESNKVQVFTNNSGKWDYLRHLGLVTSPQRKVTIEESRYRWNGDNYLEVKEYDRMWMFHAVKLQALTDEEWWPFSRQYEAEMDNFRSVCYGGRVQSCNLDQFTITRPAMEYLRLRGKKYGRPDMHQYNWLKCPITGVIFPYDVMHIPFLTDRGD